MHLKPTFLLLFLILISCGSSRKYSREIIGTWQITRIETKDGEVISEEPFYNEYFIYQKGNIVIHKNDNINVIDTGNWSINKEILYEGKLNEELSPFGEIISFEASQFKVIPLTAADSILITFGRVEERGITKINSKH